MKSPFRCVIRALRKKDESKQLLMESRMALKGLCEILVDMGEDAEDLDPVPVLIERIEKYLGIPKRLSETGDIQEVHDKLKKEA